VIIEFYKSLSLSRVKDIETKTSALKTKTTTRPTKTDSRRDMPRDFPSLYVGNLCYMMLYASVSVKPQTNLMTLPSLNLLVQACKHTYLTQQTCTGQCTNTQFSYHTYTANLRLGNLRLLTATKRRSTMQRESERAQSMLYKR
jgi:hypothetical protein